MLTASLKYHGFYWLLKMYRRIEQQAGFIEFAQLNFDEARDLFAQGQLDVREVCVESLACNS